MFHPLSSPPSIMDHFYYPQGWVCFTLYLLLRPSWITFITPRAGCVSPSIFSSVHHGSLLLPAGLGVFHPLSSPPSIMDHFYYPQGWVCFTLYLLLRPSWITFITPRAGCVSPSIFSSVHHGSLLLPAGLGVFHPLSSPPSIMDHFYYPQGWVCFTLYLLLRPSWITFITPRDRCVSPSILSSVHHGSLLLPAGLGVFHPLSSPPSIMDHFYYHQGWVCFTLYPFPPPSGITCTVRRGMDTSTVSPPPPLTPFFIIDRVYYSQGWQLSKLTLHLWHVYMHSLDSFSVLEFS